MATIPLIDDDVSRDKCAFLNRAMAQNPNRRYASAAEFRDSLRRLGRTEFSEEVEIVSHTGVIDATVVEFGETTVLARKLGAPWSRLRSHALKAAFLLLLAAFGVF